MWGRGPDLTQNLKKMWGWGGQNNFRSPPLLQSKMEQPLILSYFSPTKQSFFHISGSKFNQQPTMTYKSSPQTGLMIHWELFELTCKMRVNASYSSRFLSAKWSFFNIPGSKNNQKLTMIYESCPSTGLMIHWELFELTCKMRVNASNSSRFSSAKRSFFNISGSKINQ